MEQQRSAEFMAALLASALAAWVVRTGARAEQSQKLRLAQAVAQAMEMSE
jgi:hypothetical protein